MLLASEKGANRVVKGDGLRRVPQGPDGSPLEEGLRDEALPADAGQYAKGADANDVYHVYGMAAAWTRVEAIRKAGQEPDARAARPGRRVAQPPGQPVPPARHLDEDRARRPLPDRPDAPAALAEERLAELRRPLDLPRRLSRAAPRRRPRRRVLVHEQAEDGASSWTRSGSGGPSLGADHAAATSAPSSTAEA